jgi:hypothetical protein
VKYAVFYQVFGEWRDGGFYYPTDDKPADKQIAEMQAKCEEENGAGTFRTFAFLDEPHKDTRTDEEKTVDSLAAD